MTWLTPVKMGMIGAWNQRQRGPMNLTSVTTARNFGGP